MAVLCYMYRAFFRSEATQQKDVFVCPLFVYNGYQQTLYRFNGYIFSKALTEEYFNF